MQLIKLLVMFLFSAQLKGKYNLYKYSFQISKQLLTDSNIFLSYSKTCLIVPMKFAQTTLPNKIVKNLSPGRIETALH